MAVVYARQRSLTTKMAKKKKETYKAKEGDTVYEVINDPKAWPRRGKYKAISPSRIHKIEFFENIGLVQTAGYKTRKAKHNA